MRFSSFTPLRRLLATGLLLATTGLAAAQHLPTKTPAAGAGPRRPAPLANGERPFRTSDSVRLFVKIAGRGLPCVFVAGGPGAGSYGF